MKKFLKILCKLVLILVLMIAVIIAAISVSYHVKASKVMRNLRNEGYENLVSVGDYSLNVLKVGNEEGSHTFVCCAGEVIQINNRIGICRADTLRAESPVKV